MATIELEIEGSGAVPATEALLQMPEFEGVWEPAGPETPRGALATIATVVAISVGSLTIAEKLHGWYQQRRQGSGTAPDYSLEKVVLVKDGRRLVFGEREGRGHPTVGGALAAMQTLYIRLHPVDDRRVELRYWREGQSSPYDPQPNLPLADIQQLLEVSEQDYYVLRPNLQAMGQQLFHWLDGAGRWLSQAIAAAPPTGLVLAIAASDRLGNLPWEVLHDGTGFLAERAVTPVVPLRWVDEPAGELPVRDSGLQVLFMATSPEGILPVLDFEREEAEILRVTEDLPLQLRVEESGCVELLGKFWRRFPENTFDVFHLTGHGDIKDGTPIFITESPTGDPVYAAAPAFAGAFGGRFPRLAFLSGCRTSQGGNAGAFPSLAEDLVRQGFPAVLGWGRPIGDVVATDAARHLYERLSEGFSIAAAVGSTQRFLQAERIGRLAFTAIGGPPRGLGAFDQCTGGLLSQRQRRAGAVSGPGHPASAGGDSRGIRRAAALVTAQFAAPQRARLGVAAPRSGRCGQEYRSSALIGALATGGVRAGGLLQGFRRTEAPAEAGRPAEPARAGDFASGVALAPALGPIPGAGPAGRLPQAVLCPG